jgi:16S rRNA (guanine527-N7)-methyltransferase
MRKLLAEGAAALGLELTAEQLETITKYLNLLNKWNRKINLTGTRDERELATHHAVDSLAVVGHVPAAAARLIDVGSGGGFPGAMIAIMQPHLRVTALEPNQKKHAFLATVRRELGLANLEPRPQRHEEHLGEPLFRPYDVAVSRATFAIPEWLERGRGLVRSGGLVVGMEGSEQHDLPTGAARHPYTLGDRTRAIIVLPVRE